MRFDALDQKSRVISPTVARLNMRMNLATEAQKVLKEYSSVPPLWQNHLIFTIVIAARHLHSYLVVYEYGAKSFVFLTNNIVHKNTKF